MPLFEYKAVSPEGKVVEGSLQAPSEKEVLSRLKEQGQMPIRVGSGMGGLLSRDFQLPWNRKRVPRKDLMVFTQELATLVQAGLPLDRSLSILADLTDNEFLSDIIRETLRQLKEGKSLSEGLGAYPQAFPKVYVNLVRAGEMGGVLDQILQRLVEYLERAEELKDYLVSSLIYPIILTFVSLASIAVMITFVIPKFAEIFQSQDMPIPLPMRILLGASEIITGFWGLIGLLVGLACYLLILRWHKAPSGRLIWDRNLLRTPLLGNMLLKLEVSRFSRTLGTLLNSAVPLIQSINIVKEVVANQHVANALEPIKTGVKKGEGLARPFRESKVFPSFAVHLLEVGEETGRLDAMLLQIAEAYDRETKNSTKRMLAFVEPAIILFMGLVIGTMVVSILYSIFSINNVAL